MRNFEKQAAQGDILITRIGELPANIVEETKTTANGDFVVAHSETGHHHVIAAPDVNYFYAANDDGAKNEFVSYLKVKKDTVLRHLRGFDTHEPINISKGLYKINRQREYTAEGFRKAAD